jgi:rhamnose transport system substrate-binding protein
MRRFIKNGTVTKFALWNPADMGYLTALLLDGMLKGTVKPKPGRTFPAGKLLERKFERKNVVITGPPLIFDKNNIDQYNF